MRYFIYTMPLLALVMIVSSLAVGITESDFQRVNTTALPETARLSRIMHTDSAKANPRRLKSKSVQKKIKSVLPDDDCSRHGI